MTDTTENWSGNWKSSKQPSKQRKYRQNAPLHVKDKLVSANLHPELREELGTRSLSLKTGDRVKVMRGDEKGSGGIVSRIDRREEKVYVDGIEVERTDGTEKKKALRPSNLQIKALNVDDQKRLEKYEVSDFEDIKVEEEKKEEALEEDEESEMMQQMQTGESSLETEDIETQDEEEEAEDQEEEDKDQETGNYDEIVSGTISDAKEQLKDMEDVDWNAVLEAEQDNKNRTTFTDWIEKQKEN